MTEANQNRNGGCGCGCLLVCGIVWCAWLVEQAVENRSGPCAFWAVIIAFVVVAGLIEDVKGKPREPK